MGGKKSKPSSHDVGWESLIYLRGTQESHSAQQWREPSRGGIRASEQMLDVLTDTAQGAESGQMGVFPSSLTFLPE